MIDQNDLSNKKVYMYATNAGWLGHTFKDFIKLCPSGTKSNCKNIVFDSTDLNKLITSQKEIDKWAQEIKGE